MSVLAWSIVGIIAVALGFALFLLKKTFREHARFRRSLDLVMLQVLLPKDLPKEEREEGVGQDIKERIAVAEQWLSTLSRLPQGVFQRWLYGAPVVALEIVALPDGTISFYIGAERKYADHLEKQVYAFYPEAEVRSQADYTIFNEHDTVQAGWLKLARPDHLPIATYKNLEADPVPSLTAALAKLQQGDAAVIQYLLTPATRKIQRKGRRAAKRTVTGRQRDVGKEDVARDLVSGITKSSEERQQEMIEHAQLTPRSQTKIELVEGKVSEQQFAVNVRLAVATRQPEDAERVFNALSGAFTQYDLPDLNSLQLKQPRDPRGFVRSLVFRVFQPQQANTLSTTEVASLFHLPLPTTATPNILWRGAKVAPAPTTLSQAGVLLGQNSYRGVETPVHLSPEDRRRHMYLIGQTGTGKTTLFLNMIVQDIQAGHGVGVVDPHGDLIEDILLHIPPERAQDVILFDPTDTQAPLGFNILEAKDDAQRDLIVNEVVQILQSLAARLNPESVGPMFEHYLRNALLALAQDEEATLVDVPRMFVDEKFRQKVLQHNQDPTVRQFWEQEFAQSQRGQMSADMLSYVISKLGRFIGNAVVRNIIGQANSSFDVRAVMDERKILLCNLSKGNLGDINADLLGFVLVSKIQIAALGRANVPADQRPDFYLYLDEFQNFTTESIATILSEARKYNLNLNMTHQFIQQLDEPIREAVFGNVGTVISYRIGVEDAEFMEKQFEPVFSDYDLINLEKFSAVIRPLVNGAPARPFSLQIPAPPVSGSTEIRDQVKSLSRAKYGRDKQQVEQQVLQRFDKTMFDSQNVAPSSDDYLSESLFDIS